jgi:capsular exopolysaccharide synthesis family protein
MIDNSTPPEEHREVHLLDYLRMVWRGRWTAVTVFAVVVTLVAVGTFTQKPVYRARTTVEITPQPRKVTPLAEVAELGTASYGWFAEERYFNTQYEILRSRDVAQRVFERLDLYQHPVFKKSTDPIAMLAGMVQVNPIKDTGIVEVSIEGQNPEEAAAWVNGVVEAYVDRNLNQAVQATTRAVQALLSEIQPLKEKLESTQRDSFEFAERANLYVPENQQKITNEKLSAIQTELTETQVKKAELEVLLRQIDAAQKDGAHYETIQAISADPVVQGLHREKVSLEREYDKLLVTYRDRHLRVLEKQKEIEKTQQKIQSEAERLVAGFRTEYALLRDREAKLLQAADLARTESLQVNRRSSSYELVRGEATETKRIYDLISTRVKEINLSASLLNNNVRLLDKAIVPRVPVKPRVMLNLAVGVVLGLLLGVGTVFFLDYMDNTIRSSEDVEQYLKLNLLAIVPRQEDGTESSVREAYQTLRTSLLFSRKTSGSRIVLVTSAGPQEGKSCTVLNMARTLAGAGERSIVLDCDLRRPTIHQRLGTSRDDGITNFILSSKGDDWRAYVKPTDQPNLSAMTCGPIPPNPLDVFGHERFLGLLKDLRQEYDWIFVDSPPVVSLSDSMILASLADMVVFVVKHNSNDKELIRRSVQNVRRVNPNVIGAVLNNVNLDRSHYKDYYYVGYYSYGEESDSKSRGRRKDARLAAAVGASKSQNSLNRNAG